MLSYSVNGEGRLSSPLQSTGTGPCIHLPQCHLYLQSWPFCICWFGYTPLFLVLQCPPVLMFFILSYLSFGSLCFCHGARIKFLLLLSFLCSQVEFGPALLWAPPGGEFHSSVDTPVLYLRTSSGLHSLPGWSHIGFW